MDLLTFSFNYTIYYHLIQCVLLYKSEGVFAPKIRLGQKSKVDKSKLEEFVRNNPNTTLSAAGIKFRITAWQVGRILKKLGFSYKKKPLPTWKQVKKREFNTKN